MNNAILAMILFAVLDGTIEGIVINWRTRRNMPDLVHTWLLVIRLLVVTGIVLWLVPQPLHARPWDQVARLALAMLAVFGPFHRIAINTTRHIAFSRLAWYRMKHDGYDGLWYLIAGHERGAFLLACLVEWNVAAFALRTFAA